MQIDYGVPLPIAVIPFGWNGTPGTQPIDLHVTIANDLARNGNFATMDEGEMPQKPVDFGHVNFRDWQLLRMENIVIGNLKQTQAGDFEIEFGLLDVFGGSQLTGFRIKSNRRQLRQAAHRIGDIIYEKLTGVRGAFDTRIAYVTVKQNAAGEERYSLQIADADGFNPQVLLESDQSLMSPAWSPDGQYLAYVSFEEDSSSVFVQNIRTGERNEVASNTGIDSTPAFSPDGGRLGLTLSKDGDPEIYVLHLSANSLQRITRNRAIDTDPDWSPDGSRLVFTSDRGGTPQIYEVDLQGGTPKRLTFEGAYFAQPRYSPDGAGITMVHGENGFYRIGYQNLKKGFYLDSDQNLDNDRYLCILTDNRLDESPSFSPDGSMIIYATTGQHGSELAVVSANGGTHHRLALQDGEVKDPAWGPSLSD